MKKLLPTLTKLPQVLVSISLGGLLVCGNAMWAIAGGFTQPQGEVFTSVTFRTFESGDFEKLELQGYIEYGLSDDTTLILKVPFQWLEQAGRTNQGVADLEVGGRWRYYQDDNLAASIQGILILPPGYDAKASPALGSGVVGAEVRLPVSQSYKLGKHNGYWTVEAAYRDYFGSQSDELRVFAEVSQDIAKPVALAVQLDFIHPLQDELVFRPEEADTTKLIGQVRWKVLDKTTLIFGGFSNVTGADASGIEVQLWHSFSP
ncbi:MAG: hypothetical protein HC940_10440 [Acaryochloris sp. SU_5_25]|nr:hypothetical protein [Acaryochloris sp. SU_5_25]